MCVCCACRWSCSTPSSTSTGASGASTRRATRAAPSSRTCSQTHGPFWQLRVVVEAPYPLRDTASRLQVLALCREPAPSRARGRGVCELRRRRPDLRRAASSRGLPSFVWSPSLGRVAAADDALSPALARRATWGRLEKGRSGSGRWCGGSSAAELAVVVATLQHSTLSNGNQWAAQQAAPGGLYPSADGEWRDEEPRPRSRAVSMAVWLRMRRLHHSGGTAQPHFTAAQRNRARNRLRNDGGPTDDAGASGGRGGAVGSGLVNWG